MYEWYTTYEPINSNTSSGSIPIANFLLSYGSSYSFPLNNNLNCSEVDILFNSSDVIVAICSCVVDDEDNEADEESWREVREIDGENALQLHDSSVAADIMMYFIFLLFIISDGDQFVWGGHYNIVTISWQTPFCNIVSFYVYWTTSEIYSQRFDVFEEKDIINAVLKPPQKSDEWKVPKYLHTPVSRGRCIRYLPLLYQW